MRYSDQEQRDMDAKSGAELDRQATRRKAQTHPLIQTILEAHGAPRMTLRDHLADEIIEAELRGEVLPLDALLGQMNVDELDELRRDCEDGDWPDLEAAVEAEIVARRVNT